MSGYADILLYALFTAVSFTFIDKLDDTINPYMLLFMMTLLASVFFNIVNYKTIKMIHKVCWRNKLIYLAMTAAVGSNWLCSIFAPNLADPFIYLAFGFLSATICGFIFMKKETNLDIIIHVVCILVFVIVILHTYLYYDIKKTKSLDTGLVLGVISGISLYVYAHFSSLLAKKGSLSATQVLAVRAWPLLLCLIIVILKDHISFSVVKSHFAMIVIMAGMTLVLPIYYLQSAIKKLGATKFSVFAAITPGVTFIIYSLDTKHMSKINLEIALIITAVLMLSKIIPIGTKMFFLKRKKSGSISTPG